MHQKEQKTTDFMDYIVEREFLGSITVTELIVRILQAHLSSSAHQGADTL